MNDSNQTSQPATNHEENYFSGASIALHPSLTPEMPADFAPEPVERGARFYCKEHGEVPESEVVLDCMFHKLCGSGVCKHPVPSEPGEQPDDNYIGWAKYAYRDGQPTRLVLCDSDAERAFKIYRRAK